MSFQLPPIPEAILNTEVTITSNSGRDDFGNLYQMQLINQCFAMSLKSS